MTLTDAELALIQNIKETVTSLDIRMERNFESLQNQVAGFHSPDTCSQIREVKIDIKEMRDQQKKWIGGLSVIGGIVGLIIAFKDNIVQLFKR